MIHARQVTGALPQSPDDSWPASRAITSRWWVRSSQAALVRAGGNGVWVQAVHDGKSIAMRVTWDDRSQSPDTAWNQFTKRVLASMVT